jgi:hypothetical protein
VTTYFEHIKGGFSLYVDTEDVSLSNVRFLLMRYGEDPDVVLKTFWEEHPNGDFLVCPMTAYGLPPRRKLCSQKSLSAALQTVVLEHDGFFEKKWKQLAEEFEVAWPKRLQPKQSRLETEPKAA